VDAGANENRERGFRIEHCGQIAALAFRRGRLR
jgi:hypothetical protein